MKIPVNKATRKAIARSVFRSEQEEAKGAMTNQSDDLVARLKNPGEDLGNETLRYEAAAEITRLKAEVETVRLQRDSRAALEATARREGWEACRERDVAAVEQLAKLDESDARKAINFGDNELHARIGGLRAAVRTIKSLPYEEPTGHRDQPPSGSIEKDG